MLPGTTADGRFCYVPYAGGAVFNTAMALGRLGAPSAFLSGVSRDLFGTLLVDRLAASGVDCSLLVRADRPATLAFVELKNGKASYAFYDEATAGRMLAPQDLPAIPDGVTAMFFGGISLAVEPAAATYEGLMLAEAQHRVMMLDANIRPGFIGTGENEARYRARMGRMIAAADLVKLSDEDLFWLEGPGVVESLARGILTRGPKVVFITLGEEGAIAVTARGIRRRAAVPVRVADTVGAGDTFNAGVLCALHEAGLLAKGAIADLPDAALDGAIDMAVRAAAVTVSRPGADPPFRADLG